VHIDGSAIREQYNSVPITDWSSFFCSFEASGVSSIVAVRAHGFLKLGGQYVAGVEAAFMPLGQID
jgi:hypothetical protein